MPSHVFSQATAIHFTLPEWLSTYTRNTAIIPSVDDRMHFVIEAAQENVSRGTGGPFAAAVFECDSGRLVSLGVNLVTSAGLSVLHAEIVALTLAQQKLEHYDLHSSGLPHHQLVTSAEPCAMCLGAIPWSGVKEVVSGATDADARSIGFDEGPKIVDWQKALEERGIQVTTQVHRTQAAAVLKNYLAQEGHIYNSREGD